MFGQPYGIKSVMLFPKSLRNTWELMNFIGNMVGTLKSKNKSTPPTPPPLPKKGNWAPLLVHVEHVVHWLHDIFLSLKLTTLLAWGNTSLPNNSKSGVLFITTTHYLGHIKCHQLHFDLETINNKHM
jgi:hypothetical protein